MMVSVVSMVRWRADRLMGVSMMLSRSSERSMVPGLALGELGLLPNRRVDDCELMFLWLVDDDDDVYGKGRKLPIDLLGDHR